MVGCDSAFDKSGSTAEGVIVPNSNGHISAGNGRLVQASSEFMAEAPALREACFVIASLNISASFIFSDCEELEDLCRSSKALPWEISSIVFDTRNRLECLGSEVVFVERNSNRAVVHYGAALARKGRLAPNWMSSLLVKVCTALFCGIKPP